MLKPNEAQVVACQVKINCRDVTHPDGEISYEQVVEYAHPGFFTKYPDPDPYKRPVFTVTYRHKVPWNELLGERNGSLTPGQRVKCTGGMIINCCITGNA